MAGIDRAETCNQK